MAENDGRVARWQKISIDHVTYTSNLILTLALASFVYSLTFSKDSDFVAARSAHHSLGVIFLLGLLSVGVSIVLGLLCSINRLRDFAGTAKRARGNPDAPSKERLRQIGRLTWKLLYGQIWGFLVAVLFGAVVIGTIYFPKLI
jgi:hypothetical protein